jgi:large subunit ribosomal protein L36e
MWVVAHAVIGCIFLFYVIDTGFNIFMCRPREKYWNRLKTGSCYDWDASMLGTGFFNVFSDFALLLLPVRSIWKLHVPIKKKLGVLAVFATGLL